ncbi:MAG: hypothetical protein HDQ88_01290 [Clostridia bacterium]|nr:hypothetical protein [Clostridia bacterium]
MSIELAIVMAIKHKLEIYPWMETFFINDEEMMDYIEKDTSIRISKRTLNRRLKSMKPIFRFHETLRQNKSKKKVYAFNSWELAKKVETKRNGNNTDFILRAMTEYLGINPDGQAAVYQ